MNSVRTTCPYCGTGCGIVASVDGNGAVSVKGDPEHPANFGRLCSKGMALPETVGLEGRLLYPEVNGQRVDWDTALDAVAKGFSDIIAEHGPDAVAFYLSGQLLTEDYYVANKLMKGFIGSANVDTNSRLCMSSAVAGQKRAFGSDTVPGCYEDLERAKLIVLTGSNTAWCHPVLYQRIVAAKRQNPDLQVVVIDPRRTATCDVADLHLPLAPGSDAVLFNGLLAWLDACGERDDDFIAHHTDGAAEALAAARESGGSTERVARRCGLEESDVAAFYRLFARTERVVTCFSQGINQSASGTDKVNAIINCHLLTGRIGRPGMGPLSLTGQPNAMGGREVGGLANQLAAHMEIEDAAARDRVRRFWNAPALPERPGLKAVDLFDAIGQGRVKAVWIMGTNPAVSLPQADRVRAALARCRLVVVSDVVARSDTVDLAHVRLPALAWGEKAGSVTNSERRISRQRAFLPPPGEARPDWWAVCRVAERLGYGEAFAWQHPGGIFHEHARLSAFENGGERGFDIGALAERDYESLAPIQWPVTPVRPQGASRLFNGGGFYTRSRRARLVAVTPHLPGDGGDRFPLWLNTGRVRDQWHTMTRTGIAPRLSSHTPEPFVEVHPQDAIRFRLEEGGLARVSNDSGEVLLRVRTSSGQRPGSLFVPIHWSGPFAALARVDALVAAMTDPVSGQPESKRTPVSIEPWQPLWHGFLLSRERIALPGVRYWACARGAGVWRYELAGDDAVAWEGLIGTEGECIEYRDGARLRVARLVNGRLESCLFTAGERPLQPRDWLEGLFARETLELNDRTALLAARSAAPEQDRGPIICACKGVGERQIVDAVEKGCDSVEAIGGVTGAGTGCGSCVPEIKERLLSYSQRAASFGSFSTPNSPSR